MALLAVLTPLVLLPVLVALGRYEELMLPPLADEAEAPDGAAPDGAAPDGAAAGEAEAAAGADGRQV